MNSFFSIQNDEIKIHFNFIPPQADRDKLKALQYRWDPTEQVWHAPYSAEREKLAGELTEDANGTAAQEDPIPTNATLDELIEWYLSTESDTNADLLADTLKQSAADRIDEFVAGIRRYRGEEKEAMAQKKSQEAIIKDAVAEWVSRKKIAEEKRKFLEMIIKEYCLDHSTDCISGQEFNVSVKEFYSYKISAALEEAIRQRAHLPEWISLELKLDQKAIKQMDMIPEGIETVSHYSVRTSSDDDKPNVPRYQESLDAFRKGKTINQIAKDRGFKWITIFRHLTTAMKEGVLNIYDYISPEDMDNLRTAYSQNSDLDAKLYSNYTGRRVSFDIVMLGMAAIRQEAYQNEDMPAEFME